MPDEFDLAAKITLPFKTAKCITKENLATTEHWSANCYNKPTLKESNKIKIYYTISKNFVYCPGTQIEMFNTFYPGPDYVFSLSPNISFNIDDISYSANDITLEKNLGFSHDLNFQVNLLMHEANFSYIKLEIEDAEKESGKIDDRPVRIFGKLSSGSLFWRILESTLTAAFILVIVVGLKHARRYLVCNKRSPSVQPASSPEAPETPEVQIPLTTRSMTEPRPSTRRAT